MLTARNALAQGIVKVLDEERPSLPAGPRRPLLYAVFTANEDGTPGAFCALVSEHQIARHPERIFADLLPPSAPKPVAPGTPLEKVLAHMASEHTDAVPVLDPAGEFVGAVTHLSALTTMLVRGQPRAAVRQLEQELEEDHALLAHRAERIKALHGATLRLLSLLAIHDVEQPLLQGAIEALADLVHARYGAIGLLDEAGALEQFAYTGVSAEEAARIGHRPEGKGLLGVVIKENRALRVEDLSKDPRSAGFPPHHPPMKNLLAVPISQEGRVYGRVYLCDKTDHTPFEDEDEKIVAHFADALALALAYHRARAERNQAEARSHAFIEAIPDLLFRIRGDGTYLDYKPAQDFPTLVPPGEFLGKKTMDVLPRDVAEESLRLIRRAIETGAVQTHAYRLTLDGEARDYEARIAPSAGDEVIAMVRDVTERRRAEQQMLLFSSVVVQTADSVIITDRNAIIQHVNQAFERITGFSSAEAVGKKPNIVKSGEHGADFYQRLWDTIERGQAFRAIFTNRRKDGTLYYEEKTITPIKDAEGRTSHFVSTGKDITARMLAENENQRTQALLHSMVENLPNMLFVKDAKNLRFVRFNKAAEELLGYSRDEMLGKSDYDFFTKEEADFFTSKDRQVLNGDQIHDIPEEPIHTRHKGVRLLRTKKIPILDETGKPLYLLGISEDITERKRTEEALARSTVEWTYAMDFIEESLYLVDLEDKVVRANRAFYQFTGLTPETTVGRDITSLMHPHGEPVPCPICLARRERRDVFISREADDPTNPTGRPIETRVRIIRADTGQPTGVLVGFRDLTRTRQAEETLRESEASLANAQRIAHLGNWDWNIVTNELRWSDEIFRIFGIAPRQFDATYEAFLNSVHPGDRQSVTEAVNKALNEKAPYSIYHRIVRPDGTERIVHEQAEVTFDENDKPIRMVGTVQDVTEFQRAQERLHYLAYYDSLTGLPNRQQINDSLGRAMLEAESRDRLVAVMFLDLDRFKNINDTLGHDVGDALLKEVAVRLKASLRPGDTISRLGGDEFTIVLANVAHVDDVARVAQKILDQFIPPFRIAGRDLFASPSIGITLYPFDDNNTENLLKNADAAMYHAKSLGRNNFQFYTAELNARAARQLELETGMRRALEREEFVLHYQPLVNMQSGLIVGMEALLRWQHPEYGLIPPMEFIPLAEETGLIVPIGEWALRTACAQIRVWHATGFPALHVAVNLSSKQLQQKNFAEVVKRALGETGLEPRYLDLELTESLLMQDMESAVAILKELKDLGVLISLDDFGTGYSSLSYLKRFPIDFLKIDRSFVKDIAHDRYGAGIVRAIIVMAHTLGIKVIAEGVETSEQLGYLRDQGCDIGQGYFWSKPLAVETFTELLHDWELIQ